MGLFLANGRPDKRAARELISRYFGPYPVMKTYMDKVSTDVLTEAYVETLLGRPRRLTEALSGDHKTVARTQRQTLNSIIQGSVGDIMRLAMIGCENDRELIDLQVKMLLQVHDELIFSSPHKSTNRGMERVKEIMESCVELVVPMPVDIHKGQNWAAAK